MVFNRRIIIFGLALLATARCASAADLTVGSAQITPGSTSTIVVSGSIAGESTFGVNILLELIPRAGATGTVTFTAAPPSDIAQLGDPWPAIGTFSSFDTDLAGGPTLNGSVDDNGTFVPAAVTFSSALSEFPIVASVNASGIWDAVLTTSAGTSSWEGIVTTLIDGTVTFAAPECTVDANCDDGVFCNGSETCPANACVPGGDPCPGQFCDEVNDACVDCLVPADCDDGVFCNGVEVCSGGVCLPGGAPCPGQMCDETGDACVDCLVDVDCNDGLFCNGIETCPAGTCVAGGDPCPGLACDDVGNVCLLCGTNPDCDDGLFCNGTETCSGGSCFAGTDPCPGQMCNETADVCADCLVDANCDDGTFCNGAETCPAGTCVVGADPCPTQPCDEVANQCVECITDPDCDDGLFCTGVETCVGNLCQPGSDPCPTQSCNEIGDTCVPCGGNAECDDGLFCNGAEICSGGFCLAGVDPCSGQSCDEPGGSCVIATAALNVQDLVMGQSQVMNVTVDGTIAGGSTFGVNILLEIVPRAGAVGTVTFTNSPPVDIVQTGDPWPGVGTFDVFDTDATGSSTLNGSVDDNGTFIPGPLTFSGDLTTFPVTSSSGAFGEWDVLLTTSVGDSSWEGLATTLTAGTITIIPSTSLQVVDLLISPGNTAEVIVTGDVSGGSTFGVNILLELVPRAGTIGFAAFTTAPPADIRQIGDPWPSLGTFTPFDTDTTGSTTLNGSVDDNGNFLAAPLTFNGQLAGFPVAVTGDASGVWDVLLSTSSGDSSWEGLTTALMSGTLTVTPSATLSVTNMAMLPGATSAVTVNGDVNGDAVFGASLLVELIPRAGAVGTLTFTPAPPTDVVELGDPWPLLGTFVPLDTDTTGLLTVNGSVSDNGTGVANPLVFSSDLTSFPVVASVGASGIWDVVLSTAAGDSTWQGVTTALVAGTIDVTIATCFIDPDCNDGNVCTDDSCQIGLCVHTNNAVTCDDADNCTIIDTCAGGICAGTSVDCRAIDSACAVGVCNGTTGLCEANPINEGVACDDADSCTPTTSCVSGICTGNVIDCSALDTFCSAGTCNPITGGCEQVPVNEGGTCNDGITCTQQDQCTGGVCSGTQLDGCTPCTSPAECDDGNNCTNDACHPAGVCVHVDVLLAPCDDNNTCTGSDVCTAGICAGTPIPDCVNCTGPAQCDDSDGCTDDLCVGGACQHAFNTAPCDDDDLCTENDTCATGTCVGTPILDCQGCALDSECDDGNVCTSDVCSAFNLCVHFPNPFPPTCSDGDMCTANDTCLAGVCVGTPIAEGGSCTHDDPCIGTAFCNGNVCTGVLRDCSRDDGECTVGVCGAGGLCRPEPANEGVACGGADPCVTGGTCQSGLCLGVAQDCSNLNDACNVGVCNPISGGCETAPANEGGACDDSNPCTQGVDTCTGGVCGGPIRDCTSLDETCMAGFCNPATGGCEAAPANEGVLCIDGTLCTENDACVNGSCVGTPLDCTGLNVGCTLGLCNPVTGNCVAFDVGEGGGCDDGDPCTDNDTCLSNACVGSPKDCTSADGNCLVGICNAVTGACESLVAPNGTGCNDGDECTTSDTCTGGACAGNATDCSGLDTVCTLGTCNAQSGACEPQPTNEGGICDDGLPCTSGDICTAGVCGGTFAGAPSVDLIWSPQLQTVLVGGPFQVSLVAASSTCVTEDILSVSVNLAWDPNLVKLDGFTSGPLSWPQYDFPNDSSGDGINAPFTGLPANDGDALFFAGLFGGSHPAPPTGTVIVTFNFTGLVETPVTAISIPSIIGLTRTRVVRAGVAGVDITGALGTAVVTIAECFLDPECDDGNICTTDACVGNICQNTANSVPCNDGSFCTATDVCVGSICVGVGDPCIGGLLCDDTLEDCVECLVDLDCDDLDICTDNICDPLGACTYPTNTAGCNDGLFCTLTDICAGGVCQGTGDTCPGQLCDAVNGVCAECFDGTDCVDGNACTDDLCIGGMCVNSDNTLPCNDGLFCTDIDACAGGFCVGSEDPCPGLMCNEDADMCAECFTGTAATDCDDNNVCTLDACLNSTCFHFSVPGPCQDGSFCTDGDICVSGVCQAGTSDPCPGLLCDEGNDQCVECFGNLDCDDGLVCTTDTCVADTCVFTPDNAFCDDGVFCTGVEVCDLAIGCMSPGNPCDNPALCDEALAFCGCDSPTVQSGAARHLFITPASGVTPVALRVDFPPNPRLDCQVPLYVDQNGQLTFTPSFQLPADWGTIAVSGSVIEPITDYLVQSDCRLLPATDPESLSPSVPVTTGVWGDVNNDQQANLQDALLLLDVLGGGSSLVIPERADMTGDNCNPDGSVSLADLLALQDVLGGGTYPCSSPCP